VRNTESHLVGMALFRDTADRAIISVDGRISILDVAFVLAKVSSLASFVCPA
jgi:hypothetical protein